jgi:hypothetical protein
MKLCTSRAASFFLSDTPNSSAINEAVSKSRLAFNHVMIPFPISFFITSGSGTQIFSENSFTVMCSSIVTSVFLTRLSEVVASLCTFAAGVGLGASTFFSCFLNGLFCLG